MYLALGKPDTALAVIQYAENHYMSTATIDPVKSTLGEHGQKQEATIKTVAKIVAADKNQKKDSVDSVLDTEFKVKLLKCKLRIYLKTLQLKNYKKEVKFNPVSQLISNNVRV